MKSAKAPPPRSLGRPRSFDRGAALHAAMLQFWRHGYEATSLADLTAAMGVTAPSIYAAFGNKKALFLETVSLYVSGPRTSSTIIDDAATARAAAEGLLLASAHGFTGASTPAGCLLASSTASCSAAAADVQGEVTRIRRAIEARLRAKITRAIVNGELDAEVDAEALAAHVIAVIQGMSTLARDGAKREKLLRVAATSMAAWPNANG